MKLEFGGTCRHKREEGFLSCDIRDVDYVTYVCNCWEIDKEVEEGSVEEIYSRHMFEHLTFAQGRKALMSWMKVLKRGGKVHMMIPDLRYHVIQYIRFIDNRKKGIESFGHAINGFYGGQREEFDSPEQTSFNNLWDVHKSGYDEISLKELLESFGYVRFKRLKEKPWNLEIVCFKEQ